jgi:hypothetical protein
MTTVVKVALYLLAVVVAVWVALSVPDDVHERRHAHGRNWGRE